MPTPLKNITRDNLLEIFYGCAALSKFTSMEITHSGNSRKGWWCFHDGSGNNLAAAWDTKNMIVICWDHDGPGAMDTHELCDDDYDITKLKGLPKTHIHLVEQVIWEMSEPCASAGFWGVDQKFFAAQSWSTLNRRGLAMLGNLKQSFWKLSEDKGKPSFREYYSLLSPEDYQKVLKKLPAAIAQLKAGKKVTAPKAKDPDSKKREQRLAQRNPSEIEVIQLLDIALVPAGKGFKVVENQDVFQEYFVLAIDGKLIFIGFGPGKVHFIKAFDASGKSIDSSFAKVTFDRHGDAIGKIKLAGQVFKPELTQFSPPTLPKKRNAKAHQALKIFAKQWPQISFEI